MNQLLQAVLVLMLGAGLCLLPLRNSRRAAIGLASQAIATLLAWSVVLPVMGGAPEIAGGICLRWAKRNCWKCAGARSAMFFRTPVRR